MSDSYSYAIQLANYAGLLANLTFCWFADTEARWFRSCLLVYLFTLPLKYCIVSCVLRTIHMYTWLISRPQIQNIVRRFCTLYIPYYKQTDRNAEPTCLCGAHSGLPQQASAFAPKVSDCQQLQWHRVYRHRLAPQPQTLDNRLAAQVQIHRNTQNQLQTKSGSLPRFFHRLPNDSPVNTAIRSLCTVRIVDLASHPQVLLTYVQQL